MGVFTAYVQAQLDSSSVNTIATQIENAVKNGKGAKVQVDVDTTYLQNSLNNAIKGMNINASKIKLTGQTQIPSQIQKELDGHKFTIKIDKIDIAGNVANLGKTVGKGLSSAISEQLKNGKFDADIEGMRNKLQSALQSAYKTSGTKVDGSIINFDAEEQHIRQLVDYLNMYRQSMQNAINSGNPSTVAKYWNSFNETLTECRNKLSEFSSQANSFASSLQISGLNTELTSWLEKNANASDNLKQRVSGLQKQLSNLWANGSVDISAFKQLEQEFALIKKEASIDKAPFIANLQKELPNISANISNLEEKFRSLTTAGFDDSSITNYTNRVNQLTSDIAELRAQESIMSDYNESTENRIQAKERYDEIVRKLTSDLTILANEEKASANNKNILTKMREELDGGKISAKISDLETKLVQLSSKGFNDKSITNYTQRINQLQRDLSNLRSLEQTMSSSTATDQQKIQAKLAYDKAVIKVTNDLKQLGNEERQVTAMSGGMSALTKSMLSFAATYVSVYKVFDVLKQGVSTVIELDDALIDLRKTTVMSSQDLNSFYNGASQIAKDYGSTTKEIIQAAADWSRLGYNTKEQAEEMAKFSSQFATISPGMTIDDSTSALTSIMKAYQYEVKDMKDVMSKINKIGNTQAVSNADISEGLKQAASSFALTGTSFDQLVGLFTSANEVLQDSSRVGNALKTNDCLYVQKCA